MLKNWAHDPCKFFFKKKKKEEEEENSTKPNGESESLKDEGKKKKNET